MSHRRPAGTLRVLQGALASPQRLAPRPRIRKVAGYSQGGQVIPTSWQGRSTGRGSPARLRGDPVPELRRASAAPWSVPRTHTGEEGRQQGCAGRLLVTPGGNLSLRMVLLWDVRLAHPCRRPPRPLGYRCLSLWRAGPDLVVPIPGNNPSDPPALSRIRVTRSSTPCRGRCAMNAWSSLLREAQRLLGKGFAVPRVPRKSPGCRFPNISEGRGPQTRRRRKGRRFVAGTLSRIPVPLSEARFRTVTPREVRARTDLLPPPAGTVVSQTVHMDTSACWPLARRLCPQSPRLRAFAPGIPRDEQAGTSLRHACGIRAHWRAAACNRGFFTADVRSASAGAVGPRQPERRVCHARAILLVTEDLETSGRGSHREGKSIAMRCWRRCRMENGTDGLLRGKSVDRASLPSRGRGMRRLSLGTGAALSRVNAIGTCWCVGHRPEVSGWSRGCGRRTA